MVNKPYESRAEYDCAQSRKFSIGGLTHAAAIAFGVSFAAFTLGAALSDGGNDPVKDAATQVAPAQCQPYNAYKAC